MPGRRRLLTVLAAYLVVGLIVLAVSEAPPAPGRSADLRLDGIPRTIGRWTSRDLSRADTDAFFQLDPNSPFGSLIRIYRHPDTARKVVLNALEDHSGFQRSIHDPRFCYESAGWTVLGFEDHLLKLDGNRKIRLKRVAYASSLQAARRVELYGYLVGKDVIVSDFDLIRVRLLNRFKHLAGGARPHILYVGISTETTGDPDPGAIHAAERIASATLRALLAP